jgi:hypothetical protein
MLYLSTQRSIFNIQHRDLEKRLGTYVNYRKYEKYMKKNQFCDTICDQVIGGEGRILFIIDNPQLVFHSWDFPFPISRDSNDFAIPDFPGNRSGIPGPGNRIY